MVAAALVLVPVLARPATAAAAAESGKAAPDTPCAPGEADPAAKPARDRDDVCEAAGDGRTCAVGLRRAGADWETFTPARQLEQDDLRSALVVCCRP